MHLAVTTAPPEITQVVDFMGTILSTGIGSGLDIAGLVSQLVAAEGGPQTVRLNSEEARLQAKLSAIGSLRSALQSFETAVTALRNADSFRARSVTRSSTEYLSATASPTASLGAYEIEVQQLATVHRLASAAFADSETVVGTGTLTIGVGATQFAVDVVAGSESLAAIRDAINASPLNTGVVATIINGVDGARLILSATAPGAANALTVTQSGGDGGLAALVYDPGNSITNLTELQAAQDALVLIDGFAVESPTNSVSGAVEGLDITLLAANAPGETTRVSIGLDLTVGKGAVNKLVEAYNALVDTVARVSGFDVASRTGGALFGDAGLRNILFQLRRELTGRDVAGTFGTLAELGISAGLDGKLSVDDAKLTAALEADPGAVGEFFTAPQTGVAARLTALLEPYLQSGGVLDSRRDGLNASVEDIQDRRALLAQRLQTLEQRLLRQFNALDGLLAQLRSTSNFLASQLDNLPGAVFNSDT